MTAQLYPLVSFMDSRQINRCLQDVPDYLGCFCADELDKLKPSGDFSLVVNTDPCSEPGAHWQAIVVKKGECNFFCSFGGEPQVSEIRKFCERFRKCIYNNHGHQRIDRESCGGFAVYFIWALARGQSHAQVVSRFKSMRNDDDFIRRYMRLQFAVDL